jgi:16S rRNA (cytidine1402-2'-O)-methyltransferase
MPGILYIVATPIGNLEDITLRALRILKEVGGIAAEDTRHTKKLLSHYDIRTPLTSYHEHNERAAAPALVERMLRGDSIALVSDAGTPGISDPGYRLTVAAVAAGIQVTPIPGPSALIAALSAGGLPTDHFVFEGFLPEKRKQRREKLQGLREERRTLVFYEGPHRLRDTLDDIHQTFGDREIVVAREVTKLHEEFLRGTLSEVIHQVADGDIKGEFTIMVRSSEGESQISQERLLTEIERLQREGMGVKQIAELLGEVHSISKREVYRLVVLAKAVERDR